MHLPNVATRSTMYTTGGTLVANNKTGENDTAPVRLRFVQMYSCAITKSAGPKEANQKCKKKKSPRG